MNSERPLTTGQHHFLVVFYTAFPAFYVGHIFGFLATEVGPQHDADPISILVRALVCAAAPVLFSWLWPRFWLLPSLIYGFGFYAGYTCFDGLANLPMLLATIPYAVLLGLPLGTPPQPQHPELLWLFAFALWLTAFIAFIRRHYLQNKKDI
jgi:hypothetical protein